MADHIVGMMFNHNEGDILEETVEDALTHVDSLFLADDGSTDYSPKIVNSFNRPPKVELAVARKADPRDRGQRTFLLDEIRKRYKPENTWVQLIESDIMIIDTDIREAIKEHAVHDLAMSWMCVNAARKAGTWKEVDTYPNWSMSMRKMMPYAHWMEFMLYTFRPLPALNYNTGSWRPWPAGFGSYTNQQVKGSYGRKVSAPLLLHIGYRGPTHFSKKYKGKWPGNRHPKYPWDVSTPETVEDTCFFFNGTWNKDLFDASRKGWYKFRKG